VFAIEANRAAVVAALYPEETDAGVCEGEAEQQQGKDSQRLLMPAGAARVIVERIEGRAFAQQGKEGRHIPLPAGYSGQKQSDVVEGKQDKKQILQNLDVPAVGGQLELAGFCL
jgi:hypothetical protein